MTGQGSAGPSRPRTGGVRRSTLLLLPVILLAFALYLHGLEAKSLWYDELATLTCAGWGGTWADAIRRSLTIPAIPKPPLYFLLTRLFLALGDRALFLRLPAVAWATLTIPLVYALGSRLLGRRTGLLAALLLAVAPFYVRYGQEARMYTMLTFLALLSLYLFVRAVQSGRWAWWLAFALASAANLYVHLFALLPLGVMGLYAGRLLLRSGLHGRFADRAWRPAVALALVPLLFLPMMPYLLQGLRHEEGLGGTAAPHWTGAMALDTLRLWSGGNDAGLAVYLLLLVLAAAHLAVRRRGLLLAALAWMGLPVALTWIVPFGQALRARYFVFVLPVYLGLAACGLWLAIGWLADRARPWMTSRAGTLFAAALLLALVAAISGPSLAAFYAEDKQNWRDASRLVVEEAAPGDVVYLRHEYHQAGFLFYAGQWPGQAGRWTKDNVRLLPGDLARAFHLADQAGYWLIVPERGTFLPGGALDAQVQPYFRVLPPARFACDGVPREAEVLGPTGYRTILAVHAVAAQAPAIHFWADDTLLSPGACTWLRWQVENVREVTLDGEGVLGQAEHQAWPASTAGYELQVTHLDGTVSSATVQVEVRP
ncbi:MAG: hypothetical protein EHM56_00820 [Chloroflexi bacterium]|nr:MAG: hypothetical protein EHM56_00820 [Chloroflexota bacterium]